MPKRPQHSIRSQLTRLSQAIVLLSILLSLAGALSLALQGERRTLDNSLLNSATMLSNMPLVENALLGTVPQAELAAFLDEATASISDIDLILVADLHSVLRYAPDPAVIGTVYPGTAQNAALQGAKPYTSNETGPMGSGHSAYAAVYGPDGALLGFVIVGLYARSMAHITFSTILRFALIGLLAAVLASLLALRLSARIKRSLLGYEPDAFARRFHQREDILDALEEGVLAIDAGASIIFLNRAAGQLLSLEPKEVVGRPIHAVYPATTLDRVLRTGKAEYNVSVRSLKDVRVLSDRLPVYEEGRLAGAVAIFRNRTEVTRLAEDLTGVRHMVEAMRAYTHEFMNKLHVILGLLQIGEPEKAQAYIMDVTRVQRDAVSRIMNQIGEPSVAALLVGKTSRASELGIRLILDRESALSEGDPWLPPEAYVTVLGNLIENAIDGLNQSARPGKEITVSIRAREQGLLLCVEDNGPGIPEELRPSLFRRGVSTKGDQRGTGLSLVREVVDTYHGEIRLESELGVGTSFFIRFQREPPPAAKEEFPCTKS